MTETHNVEYNVPLIPQCRKDAMLRFNGPLWYSGKFAGADPSAAGHAVVIAGIRHNTLVVNDPRDKGARLYPGFDNFFKAIIGVSGVPVLHYY